MALLLCNQDIPQSARFAGANSFMLNLIRNNKQSLGVQVEDGRFDSTIQATTTNLMLNSVDMSLSFDSAANDTGYFRSSSE